MGGGQLQDIVADAPAAEPDVTFARRELVELLTESIARHPAVSPQSKIVLIRGFPERLGRRNAGGGAAHLAQQCPYHPLTRPGPSAR